MCAGPVFAATTPTQNAPVTTAVAAAGAEPQEVAQANPFSDVPPNSWAYQAIAKLASEGLIKGYPDGQFKGQRPITRYEAAVLVNRVVDYLEAKISAGQKVSADDMATVKALVDQFRPELAAVQAHLKDLDTKVAALTAQTKANTDTLNRQQFHLSLFVRPGDYQANVGVMTNYFGAGTVAPGCAAAPCASKPNTAVTTGSNPGGGVGSVNHLVSGQNTFGTAWADLRLNFNGVIDPRWSYATRLELKYYAENAGLPTGSAATTPNFCPNVPAAGAGFSATATTGCVSDYPYGTTRVDIMALKYNDPSGLHMQIGKILPVYGNDLGGQGPQMILSDYFTGAEIGYAKPNGLDANVGYYFWFPGASSTNNGASTLNNTQTQANGGATFGPGQNGTAQTSQGIWADAAYTFMPHHLNVGAAYLATNGYTGSYWNPAATTGYTAAEVAGGVSGLYQAATIPINTGSVFGTYKFNGPIWLQAEFSHRFGNDPYTGAVWSQPNAVWAVATVGNYAGPTGTLWAEAGYIGSGFNSMSPESNITSTTGYNQLYLSNPGGYQIYYVGGHWKVAPVIDFSVVYQHYQLLPGITIPASSTACPGCYLSADNRNMVFADLWANF